MLVLLRRHLAEAVTVQHAGSCQYSGLRRTHAPVLQVAKSGFSKPGSFLILKSGCDVYMHKKKTKKNPRYFKILIVTRILEPTSLLTELVYCAFSQNRDEAFWKHWC